MLGQILHLNIVEVAQCTVKGDIRKLNAFNLHAFQHLTREVQTAGRSRYSTFVLGVDTLEIIQIFFCCLTTVHNIVWQRSLTESIELTFELIVRTVVEESQGATATGSVVYYLGHHGTTIVKEKLITNANLTCRLHKHIPKAHLFVEFSQQEHLYLGIGLLLGSIQSSWEHLGVVEHKDISFAKILQYMTEIQKDRITFLVFQRLTVLVLFVHVNGLRLTMEYHQSALVPMIRWVEGNQLLW